MIKNTVEIILQSCAIALVCAIGSPHIWPPGQPLVIILSAVIDDGEAANHIGQGELFADFDGALGLGVVNQLERQRFESGGVLCYRVAHEQRLHGFTKCSVARRVSFERQLAIVAHVTIALQVT